jgi:hypothetical protein
VIALTDSLLLDKMKYRMSRKQSRFALLFGVGELGELAARVALKCFCILVAITVADWAQRQFSLRGSWLLGVVTLATVIGTFIIVRPIVYRAYPRLKRSDDQYWRRGPHLVALAIACGVTALIGAMIEDPWYGVIALCLAVGGGLCAVLIRLQHRE